MRRAWIALLVILICGLSQPPTECRGAVAQVVESQPARGNYTRAGYKGDASQAFPSVDTAQATNAQVKSDEEAQDRKTNTAINGQIRYFNGGLLIVAVFALGAAILQWHTYKAQTEIFKAQNRAFVYLEPLKLESMSTDGGIIREWRIIASSKIAAARQRGDWSLIFNALIFPQSNSNLSLLIPITRRRAKYSWGRTIPLKSMAQVSGVGILRKPSEPTKLMFLSGDGWSTTTFFPPRGTELNFVSNSALTS
jgi:hypothetical protein